MPAGYYKRNKEKFKKEARKRYQIFQKERKNKKRQYAQSYQNLSEKVKKE